MNGERIGTVAGAGLFPPVSWTTWSLEDVPQPDSYPGWRPVGSWRLTRKASLHGLSHQRDGWVDRATGSPIDLHAHRLVLGYGSNLSPRKLAQQFLGQDVVVLRAAVFGWAAVWCDARRADGAVVATLAPLPGHVEVHGVLALSQDQLDDVDRWEGHPTFYRRQYLPGAVQLDNHSWRSVEVYIGTPEHRPVLLVRDRPLLVAEVPYEQVDRMVPRPSG